MPALLLAALLAAAPVEPPQKGATPATRSTVRTLAGKIAEVSLAQGRLVLEAADGPVAVPIDRNTMVYLEARFGTLRDLAVGVPARVAVGTSGPANWIELRPKGMAPAPAATPTPTPTPAPAAAPAATPAEAPGSTAKP